MTHFFKRITKFYNKIGYLHVDSKIGVWRHNIWLYFSLKSNVEKRAWPLNSHMNDLIVGWSRNHFDNIIFGYIERVKFYYRLSAVTFGPKEIKCQTGVINLSKYHYWIDEKINNQGINGVAFLVHHLSVT